MFSAPAGVLLGRYEASLCSSVAVLGLRWVHADCAASTALLSGGVASLLPLVLATSWLPILMIGVAFMLLKRVMAFWLPLVKMSAAVELLKSGTQWALSLQNSAYNGILYRS